MKPLHASGSEFGPGQAQRWAYVAIMCGLAVSGFAQMPIFKRFYVADIPGLGWLAEFFITHWIHYAAAAGLLALAAYGWVDHAITHRKQVKISPSGLLRGVLLAGIVLSGLAMVVRNLPGTYLPHNLIIFLNLAHLGLVMVFLGTAAVCLALKKGWTTAR